MADRRLAEELAEKEIERIYETMDGSDSAVSYSYRHGIQSLSILTIPTAYAATREVDTFWKLIKDKTVVEVGAGVGFLSLEMARFARAVYAIEADPAWSWVFTHCLYSIKPKNLTWIFGSAESVSPYLTGDVAVVYTRSGHAAMHKAASAMCPTVLSGPRLPFDDRFSDVPEDIRETARVLADEIVKRLKEGMLP